MRETWHRIFILLPSLSGISLFPRLPLFQFSRSKADEVSVATCCPWSGKKAVPIIRTAGGLLWHCVITERGSALNVHATDQVREVVDAIYRTESRRVLATLIRLLGGFELAEEALHDAFIAAVEQWQRDGVPANPRAWLVSTGRFKAIDKIRRRARFDASLVELVDELDVAASPDEPDDEGMEDDRLRLIFTCCHPALSADAQVALTLREVCGLTTEEIARAFLTTPPTLAQRIVRAKTKIRDARIPYQVPAATDLPDRLDAVLRVIYLVFNEGYSASSGASLMRPDLSGEAIRLGRLLIELLPEPEALGLLALMLLHESRRAARSSPTGEIILLDNQDRSLWDQTSIAEGSALVERALISRRFGPYTLQAAITAVHAEAPNAAATDWAQIVGIYDLIMRADASPVIELNRAVAVAMRDGPLAGLLLVDELLARGELADYHLAHAARADLCRRLGKHSDARTSYERALALVQQEPERRFLERRLAELQN
ncbi:MAG: RNA polymerase sigma factor [Gammaproteobacteria bacterium]|nr:RNA polymerase sigma factor [Gammaproteobacteria bacterium]